ncbi:NmrA domain-containing protein [Mycena sanguinolenta]|uniref:NmrA domain-containing protein n=1 Tax=Mycena sanguinolenta TaxID=230812 RepID=A0A8H6YSY6_9AGAR|nr:NmrA domain-containing protein [Mycena sanguinolenta]
MELFKSFAVVGAGTIGLPIINALAARSVSVVLLSRPGSPPKALPPGVKVVHVDYNNATSVSEVLKQHRIDVVLSTVAIPGLAGQTSLVDAAKLAGVRLFSPSEYATPTDSQPPGTDNPFGGTGTKDRIAKYLQSVGLPSMRVFTGPFTEGIPRLLGYAGHGKIVVVGKGEAPVSFTAVPDIAGFVAYVLTSLPPSELQDRILRLEGERTSLNDLGVQLNIPVMHVDRIEGDEFKTGLLKLLDSGAGSTGWDEENQREKTGSDAAGSANALWPGHKWKSIREVLNL